MKLIKLCVEMAFGINQGLTALDAVRLLQIQSLIWSIENLLLVYVSLLKLCLDMLFGVQESSTAYLVHLYFKK